MADHNQGVQNSVVIPSMYKAMSQFHDWLRTFEKKVIDKTNHTWEIELLRSEKQDPLHPNLLIWSIQVVLSTTLTPKDYLSEEILNATQDHRILSLLPAVGIQANLDWSKIEASSESGLLKKARLELYDCKEQIQKSSLARYKKKIADLYIENIAQFKCPQKAPVTLTWRP